MNMSVLCFHDFFAGFFAASPLDRRVHAACMKQSLYGERVELGGLATELKETERVGKEEDHESEAGLGEGHGNEAFSDEDICSAMKDLYEFEYYFRRSETTRWLGRSGGMWGDFS